MIDYEKSFKKLCEQIHFETELAHDTANHGDMEFAKDERFMRGMISAYDSIEELAYKLEKGEFEL